MRNEQVKYTKQYFVVKTGGKVKTFSLLSTSLFTFKGLTFKAAL